MLMVSGVELYYSLARCFRDRQLEFTRVDLEMSFIEREDMYDLIEGMLKRIWKEKLNIDIQTPFIRMPFKDAMNLFGSDKPDTRFEMEIKDCSAIFTKSEFKVFSSALNDGGVVKALNAKKLADISQGELKFLDDTAKVFGAKGLAFGKVENDQWKSPIYSIIFFH